MEETLEKISSRSLFWNRDRFVQQIYSSTHRNGRHRHCSKNCHPSIKHLTDVSRQDRKVTNAIMGITDIYTSQGHPRHRPQGCKGNDKFLGRQNLHPSRIKDIATLQSLRTTWTYHCHYGLVTDGTSPIGHKTVKEGTDSFSSIACKFPWKYQTLPRFCWSGVAVVLLIRHCLRSTDQSAAIVILISVAIVLQIKALPPFYLY